MSKRKYLSTIASFFLILATACNMPRGPAVVSTPNQEATARSKSGASTSIPATISVPANTVTASDERVYPVELIAKPGILQGHGRDETEYRDLTPGSASLANGFYLKTLAGGAAVVLPDNSVMRMDAGTEVQLGMYDNGTMIWQHSGRTFHFVMPHAGGVYEVATPFGTAVAHGTEFEVRVDYPAEGWVEVLIGDVGVVGTEDVVDPTTGQVIGTRDIYGFVPETVVLLGPEGSAESWTLHPGDTLDFQVDPATGRVVASPGSPPSNDDWSIRNDMIAEEVQSLMLMCQEGTYTHDECRSQLNDLMQQALGLAENESPIPHDVTPVYHFGKLWAGKIGDDEVVTFCFDGSYISMIAWATPMKAHTLDTGEIWAKMAVFHIDNALVQVNNHGHFQLIYQVDDPLWPKFAILFAGTINGGAGQALLNGQGLTDVEFSWTEDEHFQVQATSADCNY